MGPVTALAYLSCGMLPLLWLPVLPSWRAFSLLLGMLLLGAIRPYGLTLRLGLLCLGLLWGCGRAQQVLQPLQYAGHPQVLEGNIESLAVGTAQSHQAVYLRVSHLNGQKIPPFRLLLYWNGVRFPFAAGQRWQVHATLKARHGSLNPAGFDKQRHDLSQGVVLSATPTYYRCLDAHSTLRQQAVDLVRQSWEGQPALPVLLALLFGERGRLDGATYTLLRQSGILHLLAISGLHIGLAAMLARGGWRFLTLFFPLHWQDPRFSLIPAVLAAWGYGWLAGFPPPTLRAVLMITLYALWRWRGCQAALSDILRLSAMLAVLYDPLLLLSTGFWLSLSAVAALLFWFWWLPMDGDRRGCCCVGPLLRLLHMQLGLLILLAPLQLELFHGISWTAPWINLLAVPLVSLGVVPLALAGLLLTLTGLTVLGQGAGHCALWLLDGLLALLQRLPDGWLAPEQNAFLGTLLLLVLGVLWPARQGWRDGWLGLLCLLLAMGGVIRRQGASDGWRVEMMDVGHGLAVVISRHGQALLYDTGGRWPGGDMAHLVLLPHLRWQGLMLSGVIISHADRDHNGGRNTVVQAYPWAWIASPDPEDRVCQRGRHVYWQGLRIDFLWPLRAVVRPRNPDSCVVRISGPGGSLLLTGDIDAAGEHALQAFGQRLQVTVLQVPHHGSRTSSGHPFLQAVRPELALASVARYSPWPLPAPTVRRRYLRHGIPWRDTAHDGMIRVDFSAAGWRVNGMRRQIDPHWYHAWFGVGEYNG